MGKSADHISEDKKQQAKITADQAKIEIKNDDAFTIGREKESRLIIDFYALALLFLVVIQEWFPLLIPYYLALLLGITLVILALFQRQMVKIGQTIDKMVFGGNIALLGMLLVLLPLFLRVFGITSFYTWELSIILVGLLLLLIGSFLEATRLDEFFLRYCLSNPLQAARLACTVLFIFFIAVNLPIVILLLVLLWIDKILRLFYRMVKFGWLKLRELLATIKKMALGLIQPGKQAVKGFFEVSVIYARQSVTMFIGRPKWFLKGIGTICGVLFVVLSINRVLSAYFYTLTALLVVSFLFYDMKMYNDWKRALSKDKVRGSSKSVEQERKSIPVLFWQPVSRTGTKITDEQHVFIVTAWMFVCLMIGALVMIPVNLTFDSLSSDAETLSNFRFSIFLLGIATLTIVWIDKIVKSVVITIIGLLKAAYQSFIDIITFIRTHKWRIIQVITSSVILLLMVIVFLSDDFTPTMILPIELITIIILLIIWIREVLGFLRESTRALLKDISSFIRAIKAFIREIRNPLAILSVRIRFNVHVLSYYLLNYYIVVLIVSLAVIVFISGCTLFGAAILPDGLRVALIDQVLAGTPLALIYDIFSPSGKTDPTAYKLVNLLIGIGMLIVPVWIVFITLLRRRRYKRIFVTKPRRPPSIGGFDAVGLRNALQSNADIQRYITGKHPPEIIKEMIAILGEFKKYKLVTGFLSSPKESIYRHSQVVLDQGYPDSDDELWKFIKKHPERGYLAVEVLFNSGDPKVIKKVKTKIRRKKKLVIPDYLRDLLEDDDRRTE
ncbi:MAG: hypothetical protein ACFFD4_15640 [Candidatus Odinarchaeota archaeon]